jgi:hypothetical protein
VPCLTRVMRRLGGHPGDRGAIAALVGLLLAGGVLLGTAALVIDVGLLYAEREELQSGADAASIAVAKVCAASPTGCTAANMGALAKDYANQNAKDNLASAVVCGDVPGSSIAGCASPEPANLTKCLGGRPSSAPYVEVYTTTETASGNLLPPVFAGAITGTNGVEVRACSRASWGPVAKVRTNTELAISRDKFNSATDSGGIFQPPPAGGSHDPGLDVAREVRLTWRPGTTAGTGGLAGGFAWIQAGGSGPACTQDFEVGTRMPATTTPRTPPGCGQRLGDAEAQVEPVAVAIYEDAGSGQVNVVGIAIFVPTGWFKPDSWAGGPGSDGSVDTNPPLNAANQCTGGTDFCLYGYFTTKIINADTFNPGGSHFGAISIRTIG